MLSPKINKNDVVKVDPKAGLPAALNDGFTRDCPMNIEETFWPGKKILVPNYDKILELDEKALKTPQNLRQDPHKLLNYLLQLATNDLGKYRVIFRWITAFMCFGQPGQRITITNLNDAIAKGLSTPGKIGFASIFQQMCSLAGIPCETISGKVRLVFHHSNTDELNAHTWNIIELYGKQYYCDITWASGSVVRSAIGKERTMVREFREEYFLAEPNQFTNEHLPTRDGKVLRDLQFGGRIFSSIEEWNDSFHIGPMMSSLGIDAITTLSTLTSFDNSCCIQFRCPRGLRLWHHLRDTDGDKELDDYVMQFWEKDVVTFRVSLPAKGRYKLTIYAAVEGEEAKGENQKRYQMYGVVTDYTIVAKYEVNHLPLPKQGIYGFLPQAISAGYFCLSHNEPVIETSSNKLTFEFLLPTNGNIIPTLFHEDRPKLKIIDAIYREPFPNKTAVHVAISKPGRYCLEVYAGFGVNSTNGIHRFAARYLIVCTSNKKASFFADPNPWGPNDAFLENKIVCLDVPGSTIHATNGKGCITFSTPVRGGKEITYNLLAPGLRGTWKEIPDYQKWIFGEVMERKKGLRFTRFNFRVPEQGFYQFLLGYGGKFMGRWLVACPVAHTGELFPHMEGLWGSSQKMAEELRMVFSHPVRFQAPDGKVDVTVEIPHNLIDWHVFAHLKDVEGPRLLLRSRDISRISNSGKKGWRTMTFTLNLPDGVKTAILTLSIGQEKSKGAKVISTINEGYWLVTRI